MLVGCGEIFTGYGSALKNYDTAYSQNVCDDEAIKSKVASNDDVILWSELGGSLKRNCQEYAKSNHYFDIAEEHYKSDVDLENFGLKAIDATSGVFTNENANAYKGSIYEAIMVNVYKGLNFLSLGDKANARVEFNRALDRQRIAKDKYHEQIQSAMKKLSQTDKNTKVRKTLSKDFLLNAYNTSLFKGFQAYGDFVNPFATYLSAIFFLSGNDYAKARDLLKESVAMDPQNTTITEDFKLSNQMLLGKYPQKPSIWLIYENGKSLKKSEFALNLPLYLVSNRVLYVGVSMPTLKEQSSSYPYLFLNDKKTQIIANMDDIIKTEFKIQLPFIITKALTRTILKTFTQTQLYRQNEALGILMAFFNAFSNRADTRSWVSLPKNFQAVRVENGGNGAVIKSNDGEILSTVQIPQNKNAIIFLTSSQRGYHVLHKIVF